MMPPSYRRFFIVIHILPLEEIDDKKTAGGALLSVYLLAGQPVERSVLAASFDTRLSSKMHSCRVNKNLKTSEKGEICVLSHEEQFETMQYSYDAMIYHTITYYHGGTRD